MSQTNLNHQVTPWVGNANSILNFMENQITLDHDQRVRNLLKSLCMILFYYFICHLSWKSIGCGDTSMLCISIIHRSYLLLHLVFTVLFTSNFFLTYYAAKSCFHLLIMLGWLNFFNKP